MFVHEHNHKWSWTLTRISAAGRMNITRTIQGLIFLHRSYPAVKLVWECQLPIMENQLPLISPSHYIKEVTYNTEERMSLLCKQQRNLEFWDGCAILNVVPAIICFQNFQPMKNYAITVTIRNISKRMQKVTLLLEPSQEFSLDEKATQITTLAPGMIFKATINLQPLEDRDVFHKLIVIAKEFRFAIPILALGGRGFLNPPDDIDFLKVPVKYLQKRLITTTNIGSKTCRFLMFTNGPFGVTPERGVVNAKESFSFEVSFYATKAMFHKGLLFLQYETGEQVAISLHAEAVQAQAYVTPPRIVFDDTYVGLKSYASILLVNNTPVVAEFVWKKYFSPDPEEIARGPKSSERSILLPSKYVSNDHVVTVDVHPEPSVLCMDCHASSFGAFSEPDQTDLAFPAGDFLIEPVWGEIQPCGKKECMIIFSPYKHMEYSTLAFCEMTGREERLVLALEGRGITPKFTFGFDENFIPLPVVAWHSNQTESVTAEVVFEVSIDDKLIGNFKMGLFGKTVPKTVNNFISICTDGIRGKTYVGSCVHRIIKDFMIQGGDIVRGDGTGSVSVYGVNFDDENFQIKHSGPGFVSMANSGPNTNGCQFFITTAATPWLDGHHVAFGKVIEGYDLIKTLETVTVGENEKPANLIIFSNCEVKKLENPYELPLGKKEKE